MLLVLTARTIARAISAADMLFAASAAIQACVLNTAEGIGKSSVCRTGASMDALPTLQVGAC
jgi:predicted small secreted protein